jgi:hypothetical protein
MTKLSEVSGKQFFSGWLTPAPPDVRSAHAGESIR